MTPPNHTVYRAVPDGATGGAGARGQDVSAIRLNCCARGRWGGDTSGLV